MKRKYIFLIVALGLLAVAATIYFRYFLNRERDYFFKEGYAKKETESIQSPGCFLPETDSELNTLLNGLQKNSNWKITKDSLPEDENSGIVAYRIFDGVGKTTNVKSDGFVSVDNLDKNGYSTGASVWSYWVVLVNTPEFEKNQISNNEMTKRFSTVLCEEKIIKLTTFNRIEGCIESILFFKNKNYGLLVFECSRDPKRNFTKNVLQTVSKEISALK